MSLAILGGMLAGGAAADVADQLRPAHLRVTDGTWHTDNRFQLAWDPPGAPTAAVHFRVRDEGGEVVIPETRVPWDGSHFDVHSPAVPGRYTVDLWLEGAGGETGAQESTALLFDDARPAPARPVAPAGWIAGNTAAIVRIEHPASPEPVSGIRGYAVSVDHGAGQPPCAGPDRCSEAETDLQGGVNGDTISLGLLPEGTSVVRAVAVSGSGMRSGESEGATVRVDATRPEVVLGGVPQGWSRDPVHLTASATDALSGMTADGPNGPFTALVVDDGVATIEKGGSVTAVVSGDGSHKVAFYARDAAGNIADGNGSPPPPVETVRIDGSAPSVAFARSQDPADPERIEATIADPLSGPDPGRGSIAVRPAGSRQRFEPIPTTVAGGRLTARWDSDSFPTGDYEFRATGYDRAGNSSDTDRRSNGARMVLPNPLKTPTTLQAGFGGRRLVWQRCLQAGGRRRCRRQVNESFEGRPATRTVPFGHGVQFGGRLTSIAGAPLAGQPIRVVETFDAGAASAPRTTTVETADDGTFTAHLAPGPSRRIETVFAGSRVLTRTAGGEVRLGVLAGVRIHASTTSAKIGGAPIVFSGQVADLEASTSSSGRPIELQFRLPGAPWSEFRTVRTNARGRFRYAYAFSDDDSRGVRFQFRAFAPAQDGWPYEPAASRPIFVTGR
jgi:hypothetical protein